MANVVSITFAGDDKSLSRTLGKLDKSADRTGSALGKLGMIAKGGAAAGIVALGVAAKIGWDEMVQGQKVAAQTAAVLKSTGGAANITAGEIDALGLALMRKSGTDDEAIKSGANLLLTFTNIKNEAGAGRDVFSQATSTLLDMSVAMGTDMKSSSIQLGKALNDPIKGVSALAEVGVTFTEGQKSAIAEMVRMGDTAGAQKIILGELNKEFGGSAKAFGETLPGQISIAKESFSNLAGELMTGLLPAINAILARALKVLDAFANIGRTFVATNALRPLNLPTSTTPGSGLPPGLTVKKGKVVPTVPSKKIPLTGGLNPAASPLAGGGIVTKPTLAMIGERGPEAVVPLRRGGAGGGNTYHLNVQVLGDPRAAGDVVIRAIDAFERSNGRRYARA